MSTGRDDNRDDIADGMSRLSQAHGVGDVIRALDRRTTARHQIQFSYLAGLAIVERWPSEWCRALDCFLGSLARCSETFPDSLASDDLEWAGCAACIVLNCFQVTPHENDGGDEVMRKLSSFAYYSLSCVIRDAGRCTGNALMARAALMRGPAARHVDGPWREAPACLASMCAVADDHDALAAWRNNGSGGTARYFVHGAGSLPDARAGTMNIPGGASDTLDRLIETGRAIHDQLYASRGACFERGYYNIFNIADIRSLVLGWAAG